MRTSAVISYNTNIDYLSERNDRILMHWKMDSCKSTSQCEKKMI
jgi:hypothetical protein